jgi:hypothetical protein
MKWIISCLFLALCVKSFGQELNLGVNTGVNVLLTSPQNISDFSLGGNLEFRPKNAIFSINTDPFILFQKNNINLTAPLYIKFIIGKKFRVSPSFGGFVRTSGHYGFLGGLTLEYVIKDRFIIFSKNEFYRDYWTEKRANPHGTYESANSNSLQFCLGFKFMLLSNRTKK